jgi:hypothetical protein
VLLDTGKEKRLGRVNLEDQAPTLLRLEQLGVVDAETARARGDVGPDAPAEAGWGFSVVPGLSTDGEGSRRFSLGLLGAAPSRVDVLGVSSLFNVVDGRATGFLGSGLFNVTTGRAEGAVVSGVFNFADDGGEGYHGAGVMNWSGGPFDAFRAPVRSTTSAVRCAASRSAARSTSPTTSKVRSSAS